MKKFFTATLYSTLIFFFLFILYNVFIPERSDATLVDRVLKNADTIKSSEGDPKEELLVSVKQKLISIHEKQIAADKLINEAVQLFGSNSVEVRNLVDTKYYDDSLHLAFVNEIIHRHGWLPPESVGAQASYTLFSVIQKSDLKTQEKHLPLLEKAVKSGTLDAQLYANLVDRKAMIEHKQQIFGTQIINSFNNQKQFAPIKDVSRLNIRRKEIGLPPIEVYAHSVGIKYGPEKQSS